MNISIVHTMIGDFMDGLKKSVVSNESDLSNGKVLVII